MYLLAIPKNVNKSCMQHTLYDLRTTLTACVNLCVLVGKHQELPGSS